MGYIAHDAVVVVTEKYREGGLPDMDAFRESMPEEFRQLVIGPIVTAINESYMYAFLPDGSKEGWGHSDLGDELRARFVALFQTRFEDGSSHDDVVAVRFGGDHKYEVEPVVTYEYPNVR